MTRNKFLELLENAKELLAEYEVEELTTYTRYKAYIGIQDVIDIIKENEE